MEDLNSIESKYFERLQHQLGSVSESLMSGDYSVRLEIESDDPAFIALQNTINQIIELIELRTDMSLTGENSPINNFVNTFSSFANREFDNKLKVSDSGTILDAIAAGINMLGEELEYSTVSKNELEVERNRLNQSQRIAKLGDWEFYTDEDVFICSKNFFDVLEIKPETNHKAIYEQLLKKLTAEDREEFQRLIKTIKDHKCLNYESKIILSDGSYRYLMNIVNHILNEKGEIIGYKGVVQDISQLKESQLKLAYQTELQTLISEISSSFIKVKSNISEHVGVVLKDCCSFFNVDRAYFLKFNGDKPEDVDIYEWGNEDVKYTTAELFEISPDLYDICKYTVTSNEIVKVYDAGTVNNETELEMLNRYAVKSFLCIPVYGNGAEFAIFGMDCVRSYRDFSSDELSGLKIISNIISDAISRDYFERSLIVARERAEESDRLKSAFLANMSHEIRTPMNGILGFAELLKTPDLSGEMQQEFIGLMGESGERLLNTIDDLVSISKLDSGQTKIEKVTSEVNEMMSFMYCFFRPEAEKKGLEFAWNSPPGMQPNFINTDKEKVYAVLTNLIKNAIKFTKRGKVEFGYTVEQKENYQEFLFYVRDSGIGIEPDKQKFVFERFAQADTGLSRGYEGFGLGLAISKAYVEMLSGNIWFESEPGKGTEFFFTIPSADENEEHVSFNPSVDIEILTGISNAIILIAEDDKDSVIYLTRILKDLCKCSKLYVAGNGAEAVEICTENDDIDLVLMDLKMPVMDGYKAAIKIKEFRPNLPMIAQTAFALDEEKAKYAGAFVDYITKPVRVNVLKNAILKYVDKRKMKCRLGKND